ncbi:hypothetical protein MTO96_033972 [Rhipicephalus appendiculatus]
MLRSCDIPQDTAGAIILPFLNEKSRTLVANKSEDRVLSCNEIRKLVLLELKLTPEEYKRRFYVYRKGKESWGQFVTKVDITLGYYFRSRNVSTLEELRSLIISDRAKEIMPQQACAYVLQQKTGDWFRLRKVTELAEKFEESRAGYRQTGAARATITAEPKPRTASGESVNGFRESEPRYGWGKCYGCGRFGHVQWNCPQTKPSAAADRRSGNEPEQMRFAGRTVFDCNGK